MNLKVLHYSKSGDAAFKDRFAAFLPNELPYLKERSAKGLRLLIDSFNQKKQDLILIEDENKKEVARIGVSSFDFDQEVCVFGFFEIDLTHQKKDEAFTLLEAEILDWAKKYDFKTIKGPVDYNTWFNNRFKTNGFELQLSWEPHHPHEYKDFFEQSKWTHDKEYVSKFYQSNDLILERTKKSYEQVLQEGYHFRIVNFSDPEEKHKLYELNVNSFNENYLFEPISKEQYFELFVNAILKMDMSLSFLVCDPDTKKELGYVFAYIDEAGFHVVKSLLIHKSVRGAGLSSALIYQTVYEGKKRGQSKCAGALVRRGNISEVFFDTLGKPSYEHIYHLFKKEVNHE
jgi:GNAT superfamily N-acetyltransferase